MSYPLTLPKTAILHYTAPPVVGGVEGVIQAHCQIFQQFGYPVAVIAGRGDASDLAPGIEFHEVKELDTQYPEVLAISAALEQGLIPTSFIPFTDHLVEILSPILNEYDNVIVHNVFTKHFNIPLTAALFRLIDNGAIRNCIAWCHDFTWTSSNSRSKLHQGYPWDLLRKFDDRICYVTVSEQRKRALAQLFEQSEDTVKVVYNGVDPQILLGLSVEGAALIKRLELLQSDLILLMPVRVTQAKNTEYALELVTELKNRGICPKLIHTGPPDPHSDQSTAYYESLQTLRSKLNLDNEMHFVYESGPHPGKPYPIDLNVVGDLYRISDVMLMPSHREGFGMPVLEAGLVGIPAICTPEVPAAIEIGKNDVIIFNADQDPSDLADRIIDWMQTDPQFRFRQRVRSHYTWQAIFEQEILPILQSPE